MVKNEIKNELMEHRNADGLPVWGNDWQEFSGGYIHGEKSDRVKDVLLTLAEVIVETRPPFPYREIPIEKMKKRFFTMRNSMEKMRIKKGDRRIEIKGEHQLKYNFENCGLYAIQIGNGSNAVSDYFQNRNRVGCPSHEQRNPVTIWKTGTVEQVRQMLAPMFRMSAECVDLTPERYRKSCRLGAYEATQFRPSVAKFLYEAYGAKKILDTSMGWGDRLAGFWASEAELYVGCDPNGETFDVYKQQCFKYAELLGINNDIVINCSPNKYFEFKSPKKHVIIHRVPSEDFEWDEWKGEFDYMFTSPPYFSVERYAQGSTYESEQSWVRYPTFESWRDDFYFPTLQKTWESISENGYMCVNITEPKVDRVVHPLCDDMVDYINQNEDCNFLGMVGMRLMQRPQGSRYITNTPEGKVVDEQKKKEYYDTVFIEPIWVFRKNNDVHELSFDIPQANLIKFMR